MNSRSGSILERNVSRLFRLVGFKPELNKKIDDYEIDVFVKYKTKKIGIECKQYERSSLAIRNLIHQWESKNKELRLNKILLVLVGCTVTDKNMELAKKYGISIWDTEKFDNLFEEALKKREKIKGKLLLELDLGSIEEIENEIKSIMKKYQCTEWMAEKVLRGEISKKHLNKLEKRDIKIELNNKDFKRLANNDFWYGIPFKELVDVMEKYNLDDKNIARILILGKGTHRRKPYSKNRVLKLKFLMNAGYSFKTARKISTKNWPVVRKMVKK